MSKQTVPRAIAAVLMALVALLLPDSVFAHDGAITNAGSFLAGLTHPVLGPDHLLAMLSVGVLSAQIGGRAIWTVPSTFVLVMSIGGIFGLIVSGFTLTEIGIGMSVVALGLAIAADQSMPLRVAMTAVALFAIFHGYAHGIEMPQTAQPGMYGLGFMTGTAVIHIAGVVIGDISQHYRLGKRLLRFGGGAIALTGLLFLFEFI